MRLRTSAPSLSLLEACVLHHARTLWFPCDFADGGGTTVPLSGGGARWFVALRCSAEETKLSPYAHKHKTTSSTSLSTSESNRRTAQPIRRTDGQSARENFCGHTNLNVLLCARPFLCMTGVLELDLT